MPDKSRRSARKPGGTRSGGATTTGQVATATDGAAVSGTPDEVQAGVRRSPGPQIRPKNGMDRYFEVTARRSTVGRELRGGLTTFFTMAYIVVLNPIILSGPDVNGNTLSFGSVAAVTALVAGVLTIAMGVIGRYPFALATGLGINAIVAVFAATQLTWPEIMAWSCWRGCSSPCWCSPASGARSSRPSRRS